MIKIYENKLNSDDDDSRLIKTLKFYNMICQILVSSFLRQIFLLIIIVHINNIKMIYYDRIDVSEGIDVKKTSALKKCDICYFLYFLDKGETFQPYV